MDSNIAASTTCYDKTLITLTHTAGTTFSSSWTDENGDVHQGVETKLAISNDVLTSEMIENIKNVPTVQNTKISSNFQQKTMHQYFSFNSSAL